ncbi:MAG TPA: methylated-DNA--[protein]-cysteine S-methyltransferase [Gemmatimonadales bacterium]|nr:methylated-DNA--[protein]-cysteine S-methyltransferase [Gemmatimonadales bacterium]
MAAIGFTCFDTALGRVALAWSASGVYGVQLPEANDEATRARAERRWPEAAEVGPPETTSRVVGGIIVLLAGAPSDLRWVPLDMDRLPPFERSVYQAAREIPAGHLLTYGELADRLGLPGAARAVGRALGRNPFAIIVPCHRVVAAGGATGGFSAYGGATTKSRLLAIEGARPTLPFA